MFRVAQHDGSWVDAECALFEQKPVILKPQRRITLRSGPPDANRSRVRDRFLAGYFARHNMTIAIRERCLLLIVVGQSLRAAVSSETSVATSSAAGIERAIGAPSPAQRAPYS